MLSIQKKEMLRFLVSGGLAVLTDLLSYYLLVETLSTDSAKAISFVLGSIVAFFMNKLWTFESNNQTSTAILQFSVLYTVTFFANVAVNHMVLHFVFNVTLIAFIFATVTSTVLNFVGMKFWVFRKQRGLHS